MCMHICTHMHIRDQRLGFLDICWSDLGPSGRRPAQCLLLAFCSCSVKMLRYSLGLAWQTRRPDQSGCLRRYSYTAQRPQNMPQTPSGKSSRDSPSAHSPRPLLIPVLACTAPAGSFPPLAIPLGALAWGWAMSFLDGPPDGETRRGRLRMRQPRVQKQS